jgi:hypothetical protein
MKAISRVFILRLFVCSAFLAAASSFALADPIPGTINVGGHDSFTSSSLTFISPFASTGDSGFFSSFSNGTVDYFLGTVNYMTSVDAPLAVFSITNDNGDVLAFYDTGNGAISTVDPATGLLDVTLDETGFYTLNGGPDLSGYFNLSLTGRSADGSDGGQAFTGSGALTQLLAAAPEPASDLLLGTALFGLAALLYTRPRRTRLTA